MAKKVELAPLKKFVAAVLNQRQWGNTAKDISRIEELSLNFISSYPENLKQCKYGLTSDLIDIEYYEILMTRINNDQ